MIEPDKGTSLFRCPHCGQVLTVSAETGATPAWQVRTLRPMAYGDASPADAIREATRTTPHRAASREADVIVPLAQSAITACVIALPAAVVTAASGWPVYVPIVVGTASFTAAWFWLLRDSRGLLRITERIVNRDIDGDGQIGEPVPAEPHKPRIEVVVTEGDDRKWDRMRYIDLPGARAHLITLARGVLAGKSTSEATWSGKDRPYSIDGYREVRAALIGAGYARWNHDGEARQGWSLTSKGKALFKELAALPPALPGE